MSHYFYTFKPLILNNVYQKLNSYAFVVTSRNYWHLCKINNNKLDKKPLNFQF